jgi:hypothetical protein
MARKKSTPTPPPAPTRKVGLGLFLLALALRLFFWQATPDASWPHSAYYKGDAPIWLAYASALQQDQPFELDLPLRPPGNAFLIASLWNGENLGVASLKLLWCLLGASTVLLLYGAVLRGFGSVTALVTGLFAALSTALMVLSTSLNNEAPYLLLVAATLYLWPQVRERSTAGPLFLWGGIHALACLVRVEHALYFALLLLWQVVARWREAEAPTTQRIGGVLKSLAPTVAAFALLLVPWHVRAWSACRDFNRVEPEVNAATEGMFQRLEQALAGVRWGEDARAELQKIPATSRRTMGHFVAATMVVRGGNEVTVESLQVIDEAFGRRPEPISEFPFVALYGGLNFYLANNPHAPAGFGRGFLDQPPPFAGGRSRYPAMLVAGLPPPDLALTYPPHLEAVNHGYSKGLAWIVQEPGAFLALAGRKLSVFWSGASLGLGGYGLPLGMEGLRRRVDLVVPDGNAVVVAWRLACLGIVVLGFWVGRRRCGELVPWIALLCSKLVVTVAFFGYARQGASVVPVVGLCLALVLGRFFPSLLENSAGSMKKVLRAALVVAVVFTGLEFMRWWHPPTIEVDGRAAVAAGDPWPLDRHEDRRLVVGR